MTINTFLDEMEQLLGCDGYISILENTRKLKTDSNEYVKVKELYFKANEENEELKEQITCLESDSYNEVSLAEYEELKEEIDELKMNTHRLNCSHCNLISSEDDIFLSLECGELTCEECFNEGKSKNKQ